MKHTPTNVCIDPPGFTPTTLHFIRHAHAPIEITQTPAWGDYWGISYHDAIVGTSHAHAENERGNAVRALFTTPAQAKAMYLSDEICRRQWSLVAAAGLTATTDTQWPDALESAA